MKILKDNYRSVAIESLKKIFINNSYSNIVINNDSKLLDEKFHKIYRKCVLGVVEKIFFLDFVINKFSSTKTKKLQNEVLFTMRLAVYQIFFLDNSKEFLVVNESVEHIKKKIDIRASKFVNAVLRNIIRNKQIVLEEIKTLDREEYLSITYSYPIWMIKRFISEFGEDNIERILDENNKEPKFNIRVNTEKISREDLKSRLEKKGVVVTVCKFADKGLILENIEKFEDWEEYKHGFFSIQSESSMLVGQILNPKKNSKIIDVCAAPGGKTTDASQRLEGTGEIFARDLHRSKISLIKNEANRLGLSNVKTMVHDATILDEKNIGQFDYCIVDAPCSGFGIIKRKPEIKYNKSVDDSDKLFEIQTKILQTSSEYLKVGGELVYATCTIVKKENLDVIEYFLKNNNDFKLVDISKETHDYFETSKLGYIEIFSHIHEIDGFFVAKLIKVVV